MGKFLQKGETKSINIHLNDKSYKTQIHNVNFDARFKRTKDTLQIRYSRNGELARALQACFLKGYESLGLVYSKFENMCLILKEN